MTPLKIFTEPEFVNEYLEEHGLQYTFIPLEAVLLQGDGTTNGKAAVLLIAEVDGQKRVIKTTLDLFALAADALRASAHRQGVP